MFEASEIEQDGLRVRLVAAPAVNYALVHNGVPLVRELSITNNSDFTVDELTMTVELVGPAGPIGAPWRAALAAPLAPDRTVSWDSFPPLPPDAGGLVAVNEAYPAQFRLTVTKPSGAALRSAVPTLVLAHNEWLNHPALYDALAAFVQPNTRAVDTVLKAASQILARRTGADALDGYQSGSARAAAIAGAIYEALRGAGLSYQAGSASFEAGAQKIRTTASVLEARLGNCLDLSVTYASCLEQAGLHPLIWIAEHHAFAGFFLAPERLATVTVTETNLLHSLVTSGRAVPVELTGLGVGGGDFTAAVQSGLDRARGADPRTGAVRAAVDVALAHRSGIRPLPTADELLTPTPTTVPAGPSHGSIELPDGAARDRLARSDSAAEEVVDVADPAPPRIRQWKRSLLDLSLRNPLLNLPARGKGVDLLLPPDALRHLDDLAHQGKRIALVPQDAIGGVARAAGAASAAELDPGQLIRELVTDKRVYAAVDQERYRTVMRGLQRDARTMTQETGSNYLYLTLGTLVHRKEDGREAHAPLFLLPVRLEGGAGKESYRIVIDGSEIASPNQCLIEWLRVKHRVRLPALDQPELDEAGIDIPRTLAALRDGLVQHELDYRIDERASLRLLQFATFQMWRDLSDHWSSFVDRNPVVSHFVHRVGEGFADPTGEGDEPVVDENQLHLPIPADGSQMRAVVMAEWGRSFVLEGPPGTGKSQTITNMIARIIHSGRTVLFVAEKQAALDVVRRKLDQIGLGPFTLDLHGRKQSLNQIREQLREAFRQIDPADDGAWRAATTRLRTQLAPLTRYPHRVHAVNGAGLSLWSAYADTLRYGTGATAPVPAHHLGATVEQAQAVARALAELPALAQAARLRADHPWSLAEPRNPDGERGVAALDPATVLAAATRLEEARTALLARQALATVVGGLAGPAAIGRLVPAARLAAVGALPDRATLQAALDPRWDQAIAHVQAALTAFRQRNATELELFQPEVLRLPELTELAGTARQAADRFLSSLFGRKDLRRVGGAVAPYQRRPVEWEGEQLATVLARLVLARRDANDVAAQAARHGGLLLAGGWDPSAEGADAEFARAMQATLLARALLREAPAAWEYLQTSFSPGDLEALMAVEQCWREWTSLLGVTEEGLALWAGAAGWFARWQEVGPVWRQDLHDQGLLSLHRWSQLLATLDVQAAAGLAEFRGELLRGVVSADEAAEAYRRGVAARSVGERLDAGELTFFEPAVHNGVIDQFITAAGLVRDALPHQIPADLVRRREFVGDGEGGVRLTGGRTPVVALAEQVKRKRGGMSFRELFVAYSEQILQLTPCVLVSPASAATFLDPDVSNFDVVIFDEASQIRVAEAIGAMGRGRSVVVVGDSKQMPPTAFMRASHEEDEEEPEAEQVAQDLDSILSEAVESNVPRHPLTWHYRSRDEALIAFSNHRYYDGRLFSLPSPGADPGTGLAWRRVEGTFDRGRRRTNEVEARAVVAEIARRLHDPATADASIGVVTFNLQQRDLILNLLEESDDELIIRRLAEEGEEPIFVKNLENVQGDERDVILFSLAFSKDPTTGLLPLNFGPLSQVGGERRLNVAVTRARRLVMLFASFDPADIDLSRTNAVGTRDLRAYCELAAGGPAALGALAGPAASRRPDEVRTAVAEAIRDRGLDVVVGHGLSEFTVDIAVRRPGSPRWQVAIILDGPQWAARPTVADRDSAPRLLQEAMQWPVLLRFYLPGWLRDRESFLRDVDEAVSRAELIEKERADAAPPEPEPVVVPGAAALLGPGAVRSRLADVRVTPTPFEPFRPRPLGVQAAIDRIADPSVTEKVRGVLISVVDAEGPVESGRLARLTLACFGFARVMAARADEILRLLPSAQVREHGARRFVWPSTVEADGWRGFRPAAPGAGEKRDFAQIAPEEVANAAAHLVAVQPLAESELMRKTVELLGYGRLTPKVEGLLREGFRVGVETGRLHLDGDLYRADPAA
jgi:Protein of unknown function (DUF4011)/AAA domain